MPGHLRHYIFDKFDNKCCICGWSKVNPYTIPLEIDHIDGNSENNSEDNLRLICPNCHSLTSTYRGANRGQGRNITWIIKDKSAL
ncbi:HNH endonuclease [Catenibacterium sp.]|uniref:HNH endonuclease n=1 Tax=Catenibacterium sp. TaxID=2049022 RepID=UPI003FA405CD